MGIVVVVGSVPARVVAWVVVDVGLLVVGDVVVGVLVVVVGLLVVGAVVVGLLVVTGSAVQRNRPIDYDFICIHITFNKYNINSNIRYTVKYYVTVLHSNMLD